AALAGPPAPLRSSVHVPLATQGRVVGLTYLASFQPEAFSSDHERVLAALATYASTGYRNVESSLSRLRLTARQSQVLALVAAGLSDREGGERLGLAHRTRRTHLDRLLRARGSRRPPASRRSEAFLRARTRAAPARRRRRAVARR